jgi:hypothetical protein
MSGTLYLLRQQPEDISPALFTLSDAENDIVLSIRGTAVTSGEMLVTGSSQTVTYDDLIEKIFASSLVIVI